MQTPTAALRTAFLLFAAGVWVLAFAALGGRTDQTFAMGLALVGAGLVATRGGTWTVLGIGASLAAGSVLTIGSASAAVSLLVNVTGILLVTGAGLRLSLELVRNGDAAVRPVLVGVLGVLVGDYMVVHDTALGNFSAFALVVPAAALLPLAYGAWGSLLQAAPAVSRREAPHAAAAMWR